MAFGRTSKSGRKPRSFAVLGLGSFGATLALELARFGNYVIGIDGDEARVRDVADDLSAAAIVDVRDDEALREAGVGNCDAAIVAIGENLEASIIAAINLRTLGVKTIWAKAHTKTHHRILSKLKVERIFRPEMEMAQHVAQVMHNPLIRDYVSLGNGFHVVNMRLPEVLEGKTIKELGYEQYELRCAGAMRGTEYLGDHSTDCVLQSGDLLIILGKRNDLRAFADAISEI